MPWVAFEPSPIQERRARIIRWTQEWRDGGDVYLGFFAQDRIVGGGGLHRRIGPDGLEIGYWVHTGFLRRGIATTAARLLTEASLALPGITHVEIHHDKANVASAGVPRKLGYRLVREVPDERDAPAEVGISYEWRFPR